MKGWYKKLPNESENPEDKDKQQDFFGEQPDNDSSFAKMLEEKLKKQAEKAEELTSDLSISDFVDQLLEQVESETGADSPEVEQLRAMMPFIEREEAKQAARDKKFNEALGLLRVIADNTTEIAKALKNN